MNTWATNIKMSDEEESQEEESQLVSAGKNGDLELALVVTNTMRPEIFFSVPHLGRFIEVAGLEMAQKVCEAARLGYETTNKIATINILEYLCSKLLFDQAKWFFCRFRRFPIDGEDTPLEEIIEKLRWSEQPEQKEMADWMARRLTEQKHSDSETKKSDAEDLAKWLLSEISVVANLGYKGPYYSVLAAAALSAYPRVYIKRLMRVMSHSKVVDPHLHEMIIENVETDVIQWFIKFYGIGPEDVIDHNKTCHPFWLACAGKKFELAKWLFETFNLGRLASTVWMKSIAEDLKRKIKMRFTEEGLKQEIDEECVLMSKWILTHISHEG